MNTEHVGNRPVLNATTSRPRELGIQPTGVALAGSQSLLGGTMQTPVQQSSGDKAANVPSRRILAFVLAGGEGRRLRPLTDDRPKPAVEFSHGYRIVDFVLANLANSGVPWIYLLAQYKPDALLGHVVDVWQTPLLRRGAELDLLLPRGPGARFPGTADAVYRNLDVVAHHEPDIVAVFAADHIYRMDVQQMADFHLRHHAQLTIAATSVPIVEAPSFGVIQAAPDGRIGQFQEKPLRPAAMHDDPQRAHVSMGNYLFDPIALMSLLHACVRRSGTDFGHHVLPHAILTGAEVFAYDFSSNQVPGVKPYEDHAYWRDVGTIDALAQARHDIEGPTPRFALQNTNWPLHPAAFVPNVCEVHG